MQSRDLGCVCVLLQFGAIDEAVELYQEMKDQNLPGETAGIVTSLES